ncbi:MAG: hypothetical protein ABR616_15745 [Dermatophilaceae bacterium]|nr:hypothetical protein [Intrasporangiaceae bacterium]
MSSANWFAKKLGTAPAPPGESPGMAAPPATSAPQVRPQAPQQPQQPADPNNVKPGEPGSFSHALEQGQTQGGPAHKTGKVGVCPGCGSGNYIELKSGSSCFDCGYPLIQFGSELGEGSQHQ